MNQTVQSTKAMPRAGTWDLVPFDSSVSFKVLHYAITTFRASFREFGANFTAEDRLLTGTVSISSIQTFEPLQKRLLEPDFFDGEKHPWVMFESTTIDDTGDTLVIEGDLTMKGVTNPVRATGVVLGTTAVEHPWTQSTHEHMGIDLAMTIDRRDFGVSYNNELPGGVVNLGNEVTIEFALNFACTTPIDG